MYFSGLRRSIQSLEEKKFYDIAIHFLETEGYQDLSIVDGSGDGGRDVVCSRQDMRIQLSIRKQWQQKINDEAKKTFDAGKRHFIYVTNAAIRQLDQEEFFSETYKYKGEVEVSIKDLNKISTSLSKARFVKQTYALLGLRIDNKVVASPKEVALSNLLLFSPEARALKENVIESNLLALLHKSGPTVDTVLIARASDSLPGPVITEEVAAALRRLIARNVVSSNTQGLLDLSDAQRKVLAAAESDYLLSISSDRQRILEKYQIEESSLDRIIEVALEISSREKQLDGDGALEDELAQLMSENKLNRNKQDFYDDLSMLTFARVQLYGKALDHIFTTDTFDIYRALGNNTEVSLILDSSVAMPMVFGLAFGGARSRYGSSAKALYDLCRAHEISLTIPRYYVNEMAAHGQKALRFLETYEGLPDEARAVLRASGNAYLAHYSHIADTLQRKDVKISLAEFLNYFGIHAKAALGNIEQRIETILLDFGVNILPNNKWNPILRSRVASEKKLGEDRVLIDHDASLLTLLSDDTGRSYIFATWDNVLMNMVEGTSRVYADTPSKIIDFLGMAAGSPFESDKSYSLLSSLIYCDEKRAADLAAKIESINSKEMAFQLREFSDRSRVKQGSDWHLSSESINEFFAHVTEQ